MSHFAVLVIGDNVEEQMAPFQENNMGDCPQQHLEFTNIEEESKAEYEALAAGEKAKYPTFEDYMREYHGHEKRDEKAGAYGYWENPNSKWDWYEVGGRWAGRLLIKPEFQHLYAEEKPNFSHMWSEEGMAEVLKECRVDSALKAHVDFDGIKAEKAKHAGENWDKAAAIFGDLPPHKPWDQFDKADPDKARREYWAQPRCVAWKKSPDKEFGLFASPDDYLCTREECVQQAVDSAFVMFAFLKDGHWAERGNMGWFGCVSNESDSWDKDFNKLLADVPDDTRLTIVDCHI